MESASFGSQCGDRGTDERVHRLDRRSIEKEVEMCASVWVIEYVGGGMSYIPANTNG